MEFCGFIFSDLFTEKIGENSIFKLQSAFSRTEGDSLLCGGIIFFSHFKEQKLTQNL